MYSKTLKARHGTRTTPRILSRREGLADLLKACFAEARNAAARACAEPCKPRELFDSKLQAHVGDGVAVMQGASRSEYETIRIPSGVGSGRQCGFLRHASDALPKS